VEGDRIVYRKDSLVMLPETPPNGFRHIIQHPRIVIGGLFIRSLVLFLILLRVP
jgi:hypothetical protein